MERKKEITVVMVEPGKVARRAVIDSSLEGMQEAVGGYIEPFYPFEEEVCIICNDEGKINGMPLNRAIFDEDEKIIDIIAGTCFICECGGEEFGSLSEEQIERYTEQYKYPEHFFKVGGEIKAVPYLPQLDQE